MDGLNNGSKNRCRAFPLVPILRSVLLVYSLLFFWITEYAITIKNLINFFSFQFDRETRLLRKQKIRSISIITCQQRSLWIFKSKQMSCYFFGRHRKRKMILRVTTESNILHGPAPGKWRRWAASLWLVLKFDIFLLLEVTSRTNHARWDKTVGFFSSMTGCKMQIMAKPW